MHTYSFKIQNIKNDCPSELFIGDQIVFQGSGSVVSQVKKDLHENGDMKFIAVIEPEIVEVKVHNLGIEPQKVFQGELKKSKQSKKIRDRLFILWTEQGSKGDFEAFYLKETEKILEDIDVRIDNEKLGYL